MDEVEKRTSLVVLKNNVQAAAAQGDYAMAANLRDAADELVALRDEVLRLKKTIREIRSIANLSINRRL